MAASDREQWNRRHAERYAEPEFSWQPSRWLNEIEEWLRTPFPNTRALDLACGTGRNAVWLAERGWRVDAWDLSDVALEILAREVERRSADGAHLSVETRQIDLDTARIRPRTYDLIVNVLFLDRRRWPDIAAALLPGGLLVFQTFVATPTRRESERNPDHILRPGEVCAAFEALGLETVSYDETGEKGTARLLARRT